ncbi:hypothetical protein [Kitasatospora sp. NPDC059673]|uniref:hypothetical protein n=1 Tax=Kitasatospora sp. NPDC059673 TaxID=3346901 RepID=UPI0036B98218
MTGYQDDDLQTLRRMLPAPAERDFPAGREHQREEHLMNSLLNMSRRDNEQQDLNVKRRRLGVRIALPAALVAAATGVVLTALPTQSAAAYTLQSADNGTVKLTVVNPAGKLDLAKVQRELDRLGIRARVYAGDPNCQAPAPLPSTSASSAPSSSPSASAGAPSPSADAPVPSLSPASGPSDQSWTLGRENGKLVLILNPARIPADKQVQIVFPLAKTDPSHGASVIMGGLTDIPGPDCAPALPADSIADNNPQ